MPEDIFVTHAGPIIRSRYVLLSMLGMALIAGMIHDYTAPFVLSVLLPISYIGHFAVLYAYQMQREIDFDKQIHLRERYLNKLFDFMSQTRTAMDEHALTESVRSYVVSTVAGAVDAEAGAVLLVGTDGMLHVTATYGYFPPPYEVPENTKTKIGAVDKYFRACAIPVGETILGETVQRGRVMFVQRCAADTTTSPCGNPGELPYPCAMSPVRECLPAWSW